MVPRQHLATRVVPQLATSDYVRYFPTEQDCDDFLLHLPDVDDDAGGGLRQECTTVGGPGGELAGVSAWVAGNLVAVNAVGPGFPVLLLWASNDPIFPADLQQSETRYWQRHCGCDVTSWTKEGTGHAFAAHRSMPAFTTEVLRWLHSKGLRPQSGPTRD